MTTYTLFWKDGKRELVTGPDVSTAMNSAGYGRGSLGALDFWSRGDDRGYRWDKLQRRWRLTALENME